MTPDQVRGDILNWSSISSKSTCYREQQVPRINEARLREHRQAVEVSKLLADAV